MNTRKQLYYSASEITEGLFTRGYEFMVFDTWQNYTGYYHTYNNGDEIYSEPAWNAEKSVKLVPFRVRGDSYFKYVDLTRYKKINGVKKPIMGLPRPDLLIDPVSVMPVPTDRDLQNGVMTRYFVFKRNEKNSKPPIEIDIAQANTYNSSFVGIDNILYELLKIQWKIKGPEFDIFDGTILKYPGIYDTNKRIVMENSKKFPILYSTITNYLQFSEYDI